MPFNVGPLEMVFITVVLLLLFGAKRLPDLGRGIGQGIREFKRGINEVGSAMTEAPPAAPPAVPPAAEPKPLPPADGTQ
jgi:sec-independent protein translocase protein TatA